jgi:UDP-GlcNAc3NAcA epimerase
VTLRDETEWVELVELGWNDVVPVTGADAVVRALRSAVERGAPAGPVPDSMYGGGNAAERIVSELCGGGVGCAS